MLISTEVSLRELTPEELHDVERLAESRTAPVRLVERARILLAIDQGQRPSQVAERSHVSRPTVYTWIHRFNDEGLGGLAERPRSGRPHIYTVEQRAEVIAAALTDPQSLGLPFGSWTLDRLRDYLNEHKGIGMKRSRIAELLLGEGLCWRHQETWFGERVDPDFAEKRGRSSGSTPPRRRARPSSASTRWAPSRPRASRGSASSGPRRSRRASRAGRRLMSPPQDPHRKSRPRSHSL